jgi:hypothetical protein
MTTPGTWAGWFSGAIAAAAITIASGGPASMIHPQTHPAAAQAVATTIAAAVNCPPPAAPIASSDGQPSC